MSFNRVLRSAPPEFKETNANLLQFVNQSIEDLMRADIKEEDVKEIYNRCEEHRRLWNETEIIYNSNYAIGEVIFFFLFLNKTIANVNIFILSFQFLFCFFNYLKSRTMYVIYH